MSKKVLVRLTTSDIVLTKEEADSVSKYLKVYSEDGTCLGEVEVYSVGYEDENGIECNEDGTEL
jgi:hypothetical protein